MTVANLSVIVAGWITRKRRLTIFKLVKRE